MPRGTQFLSLITQVRDETGRSNSVAVGVEDVESLKTQINRTYSLLWAQHHWPFLRRVFDKMTLNAGQRYYDFPSGLDIERVEDVTLWYNSLAYPIDRGIDLEDYDIWDPAADERSDPVLKWDVRYIPSVSREQIEVWPLPSTTQQLQFTGMLRFAKLVANEDVCLLDDDLVVLFTVARILKRQGAKDADDAVTAANAHLRKLRLRMASGGKECRLGVGERPMKDVPTRAVVRIAGT